MTYDAPRRLAGLACLLAASAFPASAGNVSLSWDPVTTNEDGTVCNDLAGYHVYIGTSPGIYTTSKDVGNTTSTTIAGLADCTPGYFAVKAYDSAGRESTGYSNQITGWPRPVVSVANPSAAEQGQTLDVVISGTNFATGATVQFQAAGITVNSVTVSSCTQIIANVTLGQSATVGPTRVDVTNPDLVYGSGAGLLTVQAATYPFVKSANPGHGATGIDVAVHPTVTFSEAMLPSSITPSTVHLLNPAGGTVPQATGSPSLSADGTTVTIVPVKHLAYGTNFRIEVTGGSSGVQDLAGHPMTGTFTQVLGFTTIFDTVPPVISGVQSAGVGATTAQITWSTDEQSDSQVFYRKSGQTGYQASSVGQSGVRDHSVELTGLDPSTTYEYHVRSADPTANATTSSPDQTFTTSASTYSYIRFEAEGGSLVSPVVTAAASGAFDSGAVTTPAGTPMGSTSSPSGTASYGVLVPSTDTWYLWVRVYGQDAQSSGWFESMDGAPRQPFYASTYGEWDWVAGQSYALTQGLHSIELGAYTAMAMADRILLTNDRGFIPTEQPVDDQTPPPAPSPFGATPGSGQNTLTWTNPSVADFHETVIRYRTDGAYPVSPADGEPVAVRPAAPGSADSFVHIGLSNGTTYSYSAFALDASGNVSSAAHVQATPTTRRKGI